jgi:short-subunit dehydrogenase
MNNIALITGASAGIGKDLAHIHAEKGGDLIIVARRKDKLEALKKELELKYSVNVVIIASDLSKREAPKQIYDEVKNAGIEVKYLINNAGFGGVGKFHERDWNDDGTMIDLNIKALTALTRFFLPDFIKRNSGRIMNVSSTVSFMPGPLQAVYFASKAYVTNFSNAIAEELHDTNVTVTNLMPGATETEFGSISGMDKTSMFSKTVSSRSVAEAGYDGMLKGKLDVISGLSITQKILIGMLPFLPKKMKLKTVRKMQTVN